MNRNTVQQVQQKRRTRLASTGSIYEEATAYCQNNRFLKAFYLRNPLEKTQPTASKFGKNWLNF